MKRYKKIFMLKIMFVFSINIGYNQDYKPLEVGDTIPESFYKEIEKLGPAGEAFSKVKEKLVILDFWSSYCATCIEAMPEVKKIQNEFKNQIQVFLVNTFEDSAQIVKRMDRPNLQKYKVALPIIANAKIFQQLFPHRTVPHHVWIDENRIVRVIGSPLNTNSQKIKSFLRGENVFNLKGPNNSIKVDESTSLHAIEAKEVQSVNKCSFLFSPHNNEYSADYFTQFIGVYDSVNQKNRDTYLNNDIMELYRQVFFEDIASNKNKIIYSGSFSKSGDYWRDYFVLEEVDTLQISSSYIPYIKRTDRQHIQSRFCYEQLTPLGFDDDQRIEYMLGNLNNYFADKYGIECILVERDTQCYILKSNEDDSVEDEPSGLTPLNAALYYQVYKTISKHPEKYLNFMIDETGLKDIDGFVLPNKGSAYTFEEIVSSLNKFGITVEEELRPMNFILIRQIEEMQ